MQKFAISPLIRITLLVLYIALGLPLPFLATATQAPVSANWLWLGLVLGLVLVYSALTEQVWLDEEAIQVRYPIWNAWLWRRSWRLSWSEIQSLKSRTTGQGGLVYYLVSQSQAYLLPMRVAGFNQLVQKIQAKTGIDTQDVRPLAQPWMYLILLVASLGLLLIDGWVIGVALRIN
jgi:hypothetical protein